MADHVHLRTVLSDYPHVAPLKSGAIRDDAVTLDFVEVEPVHNAFGPMVRDGAYDVSELAIVTALQAIAYGRDIVLLPAVVASRFQRGCIIRRADRAFAPEALADLRVGVRAYTQTTGMWVRAHLAEDYDLPIERMRWVTQDAAHVPEYLDPPFVEHATGKSLTAMLRDGDIDAAILGNDLPQDDAFAPVIPDAMATDLVWWARHGFMPINHMVAVRRDIAASHPAAVRAAWGMMARGAQSVAPPEGEPSRTLFGTAALRGPMAIVIETCLRQRLLPRPLDVDEVLGTAEEMLGPLEI